MVYETVYVSEMYVLQENGQPPTRQMQADVSKHAYYKSVGRLQQVSRPEGEHPDANMRFTLLPDGIVDIGEPTNMYVTDCIKAVNLLAYVVMRKPCTHYMTGKISAKTEMGDIIVLTCADGTLQRQVPMVEVEEAEYHALKQENERLTAELKAQKELFDAVTTEQRAAYQELESMVMADVKKKVQETTMQHNNEMHKQHARECVLWAELDTVTKQRDAFAFAATTPPLSPIGPSSMMLPAQAAQYPPQMEVFAWGGMHRYNM
jgi:hypothetical protein